MSYQEQGGGSESVVVNGSVEGIEVKPNGRYVVRVREHGSTSQYPLSLNTKEQALAQQMMNAVGQSFSFICGLSHWTNQNGQPVTSKWINGVAPIQGQPQPQPTPQPQPQWSGAAPPQPPQPPQSPPGATNDAFIRRVSWLAAVPAAVAALDHLPEEQRTVPALVKMTDFLAQTAIARGEHGFDTNGSPDLMYGDPGPQQTPADDYGDVPF